MSIVQRSLVVVVASVSVGSSGEETPFAAGRLDPLGQVATGELGGCARSERDLVEGQHELDRSRLKIETLEQRLVSQTEEIAFLRRLLSEGRAA